MYLLPLSRADSDATNGPKCRLIRLLVWVEQYLDVSEMSKQHVDTAECAFPENGGSD